MSTELNARPARPGGVAGTSNQDKAAARPARPRQYMSGRVARMLVVILVSAILVLGLSGCNASLSVDTGGSPTARPGGSGSQANPGTSSGSGSEGNIPPAAPGSPGSLKPSVTPKLPTPGPAGGAASGGGNSGGSRGGAPKAHAGPASLYPDPSLTPGDVFPGVTAQEVCVAGYSSSVRSVSAEEKKAVYARYGLPDTPGQHEVDHFISLELGGSNDLKNLWPEPYEPRPGAHEKDVVENALHKAVCDQKMSLAQAQSIISQDWYAYYLQITKA